MFRESTLILERRESLPVYPIASARPWGIDAFITTRDGGVSEAPFDRLNLGSHVGDSPDHVAENRRRVAAACGLELDRLVIARQVHGSNIVEVDHRRSDLEGDGLVTASPGVALAVLVADCVPLLLYDEGPRFAVVHAGWRGLVAGVLASAVVGHFDPRTVRAFLGPSISRENYQIGPEVAVHFSDEPGALALDAGDRSRLDLRRVAANQLVRLGVDESRIELAREVTDGAQIFFSDRAQRPCGRFALVAHRSS